MWTRTNRQTSANHFTTTPTNSTAVASHASAMTVKATETCSSRRRSQLACERMPGADKPARARQCGCRGEALTQSRSASGVYTGLSHFASVQTWMGSAPCQE
ncbi:hypothetical protein CR088_05150 [Salmonella enterica subsp. enterica serovar Dublin]|uniref:Uncharacterized protein n=1 Tax=Salmonella dublin TaxID=98360 RepID=A0A7Z1HY08_SALDU|nr:hypothetical protein CR088_05150 [Salmonella enterica subsp. enterica serovar Dublin]